MTDANELPGMRTNQDAPAPGLHELVCRFCEKRFYDETDWDICDDCLMSVTVSFPKVMP